MNITRKLPVGVQSFEKLRRDGFLYIDKTPFVWQLIQVSSPYFLSRPRRFGKSLFLSTLAAYFRGQKELFKDLYLETAEEKQAAQENRTAWQEYPVLYFDFNTGQYLETDALNERLDSLLKEPESLYGILVAKEEKPFFASRLERLIKAAYQKTGKQVVILVDEYDKPLLQTMGVNEELNEQYRNTLKAFYSVIKTCDQYIRFAFLTGVTKFSKISIFSDLNNLRDISLEKQYAESCGITQKEMETNFQPEIQVLADEQNVTYQETLAALKQWYDGYLFHPAGKGMYNPYSVFVKNEMKSYWFSTGTPTFLVNYLKEAHYFIPDLDGNVELNEEGLQTYRAVAEDVLPILFQAGYLTIKEYISDLRLYRLGFPNDEVRYGFLYNLLPAYSDVVFSQTGVWVGRFIQDIRKGDVNGFMERLKSIISGIAYDNFTEKNLPLREQNYQTAVYLVFALMGQFVQTEVHCSTGRADCVVVTADSIYIFEFKLSGNGSAAEALTQIKKNRYAEQYKADGKKIVLIGSSFDEQTRTIKDWKIEVLEK